MISALTRRAKETASLNALRWNDKMNKELGCGMMSRHGIRQQIRLTQILFSLRWNVVLIAEPDTTLVFNIFYEVFGGGTRLRWRGRGNGRGWVTHIRIYGNPGIREHYLCFDKTCQGNRLAKRTEVEQ